MTIRDAESERKTMEKTIETIRTNAATVADESRRDRIEDSQRMEQDLPEIPIALRLLADGATPKRGPPYWNGRTNGSGCLKPRAVSSTPWQAASQTASPSLA